jgi:hypothetical protein
MVKNSLTARSLTGMFGLEVREGEPGENWELCWISETRLTNSNKNKGEHDDKY